MRRMHALLITAALGSVWMFTLEVAKAAQAPAAQGAVAQTGQGEAAQLGQVNFLTGQTVAPVYEGWEQNQDGSFNFVFGFFNRNWEEALDVPVGPENAIEPDGPDRGQPTHFFPRRNRFYFRVRVPKDWGKKEMVWTLTTHGKTERAFATLHPDLLVNDQVLSVNFSGGGLGDPANKAPIVTLIGPAHRTVKVGEALALEAAVSDDGIPKPAAAPNGRPPGRYSAKGLRVVWLKYRGPGEVAFEPTQFKVYEDPLGNSPWTPGWIAPPLPAAGRATVTVRFTKAGEYIVRILAHDGFLAASDQMVINVN